MYYILYILYILYIIYIYYITYYIYIIYIPYIICPSTSCAQVHELPQSHCGDNREGTLFS